ncbi:conserved protein, unknown function [Hepatocystis sp. ex Piliocolobus tephrosceles]|nr:conserved protein, unknown function [Hepatocystis sp. ex Piliocolobus tephrosceles]
MNFFFKYVLALCTIFAFILMVNVTSVQGMNSSNFAETENAARIIRNILNGKLDTIQLENGEELKVKSVNGKHELYEEEEEEEDN